MGEENNQNNHGTHCADDFAQFFADKVDSVHQSTSTTPKQDIPTTASHSIDAWAPVTASEVEKMIGDAPNKKCNLDPAPTWLVKEFRRLLSPFVALLINVSFITGCFPAKYKHAVVSPLLKKSDADKNELKNYRPVLNLPLLSKLLEKVAQTQLQRFFNCL